VYERILGGRGRIEDIDLLVDMMGNVFGRSFCALGDALTSPIVSSIKHFRDEYEHLIRRGRLPDGVVSLNDAKATDYLAGTELATAGV
jgi:NADH-quinone oxidoreductase subunit F